EVSQFEQEALLVEGVPGGEVFRPDRLPSLGLKQDDEIAGFPVQPDPGLRRARRAAAPPDAAQKISQQRVIAQVLCEDETLSIVPGDQAGDRRADRLENAVVAEQGGGGAERLRVDHQDRGAAGGTETPEVPMHAESRAPSPIRAPSQTIVERRAQPLPTRTCLPMIAP